MIRISRSRPGSRRVEFSIFHFLFSILMAAPSKTKKIESLARFLQRRFKGLPQPPERTVLEHLVYAALLENASFDQTDSALAVLEHYFIDWNEIRVSTVAELADTFSMLPDPQAAGERVRRSLQGVFEKTYMFDLEDLRKKGTSLGQAVDFLKSISACSRFMVDYTTQVAFGGHVIPLDEASLRVFRLLGLTQLNKDKTREDVPGLERAVAKKNGLTFFLQLHHFAAGFFTNPESEELRASLKSIDADALKRDWTPPVLVVPKASEPKPSKPSVAPSVTVTIPFAVHDDDDFDDDGAGTEAEFIPEDSDYLMEEPVPGIPSVDALKQTVCGAGPVPERKKKHKEKEKKVEPPAKAKPGPIVPAPATKTPKTPSVGKPAVKPASKAVATPAPAAGKSKTDKSPGTAPVKPKPKDSGKKAEAKTPAKKAPAVKSSGKPQPARGKAPTISSQRPAASSAKKSPPPKSGKPPHPAPPRGKSAQPPPSKVSKKKEEKPKPKGTQSKINQLRAKKPK